MCPQKKENDIEVYILPTQSQEKSRPPDSKTYWHIDKEMLRFKIHFFLFLGGIAAGAPFIIVFAKNRIGISSTSFGGVLTAQMFLFVFAKPLICYIADYFNKLKAIITILIFISMACYFALLAIPSIKFEETIQNSNELLAEETFKMLNISTPCEKYDDIFIKTVSQSINDSTSVDFSNFKIPLLREIVTCSSFSENNFESSFQHYFYTESSDYYFPITKNETLNDKNISNKLKILVIMNVNDSINSSICLCSSLSRLKDLLASGTYTNIEESCKLASTSKLKVNSKTFPEAEFHCLSCNFQNGTLHPPTNISEKERRIKDFETYQFWTFALIDTISGVCINAIFTLSDTACCESIQKCGGNFGQQRLWGAISWGAIAPLAGFINDYTDGFLASFSFMGVMMALFLWNISKIDLVKPHYSKNILKDVTTVLKSKEFLFFEVVVFANGIGTGMIWYYLIWFLTSIGGSEFLCGLTLTVQSFIGVIPFMFFSGWIIQKVGHFNLVIVALAGHAIRFLFYSYLQNPWFVLPVEFLHGITFGLLYTVLATYAKLSAKPGTEATTQAIVFSTHEGLGCGIGCVLCGIGFDYFGGRQTFFYTSMFCICSVVISMILSVHLYKQKKIAKPESTQDA